MEYQWSTNGVVMRAQRRGLKSASSRKLKQLDVTKAVSSVEALKECNEEFNQEHWIKFCIIEVHVYMPLPIQQRCHNYM